MIHHLGEIYDNVEGLIELFSMESDPENMDYWITMSRLIGDTIN